MESLPAMLRHARQLAGDTSEAVVLRMETALEELFTNTVVHGRSGLVAASEVWMGVSPGQGGLRLCYQDSLAAFNPDAAIAEALRRTVSPLDQLPLGGLGLLMVYRLADEFSYRREGGRNCTLLVFQVRPAMNQAHGAASAPGSIDPRA